MANHAGYIYLYIIYYYKPINDKLPNSTVCKVANTGFHIKRGDMDSKDRPILGHFGFQFL